MSSQNSNRALSSAAAAAALRARPQTPTNVAEVQTKRTMRRSPSVSSVGSAPGRGRGPPRLERRGSSGSMTERTFRTPSPHGREPTPQHPPVPTIPEGHRTGPVRRSASSATVGMQNFRTASQKMDTELPSWYTKPTGDLSNIRTSDAPMMATAKPSSARPASMALSPARSESRSSSVNFSYPSRSRAQSPPASPTGAPMIYDPNSRRMVPSTSLVDLVEVDYHTREAAQKQPKKKNSVRKSGVHLAKGTVARVRGSMVGPGGQEDRVVKGDEDTAGTGRSAQEATHALEEARGDQQPDTEEIPIQSSQPPLSPEPEGSRETTPSPAPPEAWDQAASPRLGRPVPRKPSVVREEPEEAFDGVMPASPSSAGFDQNMDTVPTREAPLDQSARSQPMDQPNTPPDAFDMYISRSSSPLAPVGSPGPDATVAQNKSVTELSQTNVSARRSLSNSPARTARFAAIPSENRNLTVKHAPLPRSASPIKSALKHSSPSRRDASPSENGSDTQVISPQQETSVGRKKSVRVSFDDRSPLVVGESAHVDNTDSPVAPSPQQTKRHWYSNIGRSKKKDFTLEDDEIMQPRPALPSFGSVRDKKPREPEEERPLIRPSEVDHADMKSSPTAGRTPSPGTAGVSTQESSFGTETSSDQAIGPVLAGRTFRNPANISRFREPLPPIVTSAEAHRYESESSSLVSDEEQSADGPGDDKDAETTPSTQITQPESHFGSHNYVAVQDENAPNISSISNIPTEQLPSSSTDQTLQNEPQYFSVPGGPSVPESGSAPPGHITDNATEERSGPSANAIFEPEAEVQPSQTGALPITALSTTKPNTAPEEASEAESDASVYSDAYEELSDLEGGGYLSLDAIVESPVTRESRPELATPPSANSSTNSSTSATAQRTASNARDGEADVTAAPERHEPLKDLAASAQGLGYPRNENDWEHAKLFWRGLTADKRRQLEREALDDAGADGDAEMLQPPTRKPSKKKTAEMRKTTNVAQLAKAQASSPHAEEPQSSNGPDRVYMIQPGTAGMGGSSRAPAPTGRMRTSMRGEQPTNLSPVAAAGAVHMRKSMRGDGGTGDVDRRAARRDSSRSEPAAPGPSSGARTQKAAGQMKAADFRLASASAGNAVSTKQGQPALRRQASDASDSSFKRSRATRTEGRGFRRSMREVPNAEPMPGVDRGSGRFSLRSLSPHAPASRRPSTSAAHGPPVSIMARRTLRANSDHSSIESQRSSIRLPSFGRAKKGAAKGRTAKRSSRLDYSSDEDVANASGFRSRFEDSSDDEVVAPGPPPRPPSQGTMRGAAAAPPKFTKSTMVLEEPGPSSRLPDSDDDAASQVPSPLQSPKAAGSFRPALAQRNSSGIGTTTLRHSSSALSDLPTMGALPATTGKDRKSFMGNLLRRNKKASSDNGPERQPTESQGLPADSAPTSPKLQKRRPSLRDESWPLSADGGRPQTSGGRVGGSPSVRPDIASRRSASLGLAGPELASLAQIPNQAQPEAGGNPKKKKFGALRKMFKLDE